MELSFLEIKNLLQAEAYNCEMIDLECKVNEISTDSRTITQGNLFIPIVGEKFDGHAFIDQSFDKGAFLTLSQKPIAEKPYLLVEDTKEALMVIAEYYRKKMNPIVIGITGSVGKTTTKEMIGQVLKAKYNILMTYKNLNNEFGVPKTIFELTNNHEILILEMGMNRFGEMHNLSKMARPDYVVLTNIGLSHIGKFSKREDILKAKFEIFDYAKEECKIIYNGDDVLLTRELKDHKNTFSYGRKKSSDYWINQNIVGRLSGNIIGVNQKEYTMKAIGTHICYAVAPAIFLGEQFELSPQEIKEQIAQYQNKDMRMEVIEKDERTILNDSYNASLKSMKAALDTLEILETPNEKVAVLGDILELGEKSDEIHEALGEYVLEKIIDKVIFVGKAVRKAYAPGRTYENIMYFETKDALKQQINQIISKNAYVLLKGSRGSKIEEVLEFLDREV